MNKIIKLILSLTLLIGLIYFANHLSKTEKISDDLSLIDFVIKDTAAIDKIEVYDAYTNESFTVQRDAIGQWIDINGDCVQKQIVETMLNTFLKVTLKGYVPEGAMENTKKLMLSNHKTVKIYKNGKWHKTWFIGHSTADHYGTHMLLETPKRKSDHPVIMGMKGFYGILGPRFTSDPKIYRCSEMFSFTQDAIASVEVINTVNNEESFKIERINSEFKVTTNEELVEGINNENLLFYLNGFVDIHFNQPNYTLTEKEMKEMRNKTPDYTLLISGINETNYELKLHRRADPAATNISDEIEWDPDYLWGILPSGEVVRIQYFVISPLIFGKSIFID